MSKCFDLPNLPIYYLPSACLLLLFKIRTLLGSYEHGNEHLGPKEDTIFSLAKWLSAYQEILCAFKYIYKNNSSFYIENLRELSFWRVLLTTYRVYVT